MKEDNKDKHQYDDIINLQHHVSSNREHMSVLDRAHYGFDGLIVDLPVATDGIIDGGGHTFYRFFGVPFLNAVTQKSCIIV